ncbi:hypothetical protein D0Y65_039937 [Glycine soja]|uniref:Uncharacterized protein n=1 Tax=Glycine soja TaxID=3848 RepID=A0A445GP09_GLYSO|nr:hypothetical protein D0Y65_039937 [Glycine soja]
MVNFGPVGFGRVLATSKSKVGHEYGSMTPTFVNLNKWPESEVVDRFSCRQMYLRSYKFSREKKVGVTEKTLKCFDKLKEKVVCVRNKLNLKNKYKVLMRATDVTYAAFSIFQSFLPCSAKVDVLHDF